MKMVQKSVHLCDSENVDPVLGFVVLRAVADAVNKHSYFAPTQSMGEDRFTVSVRIKGVDINVTDEEGRVLRTGQNYRSILVSSRPSNADSKPGVMSAISQFIDDFEHFLVIDRQLPVPDLWIRICRAMHNGGRTKVTWDEEMEFWICPNDGLLYLEDTRVVATNPFEI